MPTLTELAPAKVNLTLRVLGRRPDGYHEIASLVAFADIGDALTLETGTPETGTPEPGRATTVHVSGPFAPSLAGENLVAVAVARAREADPGIEAGAITLEKRLPVAAGIGGGSADAGAVLRLLRRANPGRAGAVDWPAMAAKLGADVPVCLDSRAAFMTGIGERLHPLPALPPLPAVLVNPRVAVPVDKTAQVFRRLAAPPLPADATAAAAPAPFAGADELLAYIARNGNDLERPALALMPVIAEIMSALEGSDGCLVARLSGGGPTCFGIYPTRADAEAAAAALASRHPTWWVAATTLG